MDPESQALPPLETVLQHAETVCRQRRALRLYFLQALILEGMSRRCEAIEAFDRAVTRASGLGLVRCLADENWATGSPHQAFGHSWECACGRALTRLRVTSRSGAASDENCARFQHTMIARLSNREMQVLRLLGKGHSDKVIARELFLAGRRAPAQARASSPPVTLSCCTPLRLLPEISLGPGISHCSFRAMA